jgi:hypothetical protein
LIACQLEIHNAYLKKNLETEAKLGLDLEYPARAVYRVSGQTTGFEGVMA